MNDPALADRLVEALRSEHHKAKTKVSLPLAILLDKHKGTCTRAEIREAVAELEHRGKVVCFGDQVRLREAKPKLSPRRELFQEALLHLLRENPLTPPTAKEIAEKLNAPEQAVTAALGEAVLLENAWPSEHVFYPRPEFDSELRRIENSLGRRNITRKQFREHLQLTRKPADELFEFLLNRGWLRASGDGFRFVR